jgi:hypothetical protein
LWDCRNQIIARYFGDPTPHRRERWLKLLGRGPDDPLLVDGFADRPSVSFVLLGDTGEGDASQYRVVPTLLAQADDTDFMFLCSDLVYPAGGVEEYGPKVLGPYRDYRGSIYGIPGNHCWFDDADGFMYWFCNADRRPARPRVGFRPRELLWRRSPQGRTERLIEMANVRPSPVGSGYDDHRHLQVAVQPKDAVAGRVFQQPGPYFALKAGPVILVALDMGVDGPLDRTQRDWLLRTSAEPGPKILLLELPLYVDGQQNRRPMEGGGTIYDTVTDPAHEYLAVISGNTHNYQRYMVSIDENTQMPFIVSGGGGAFLHETHTIPNLDGLGLKGVDENSFRCYPLRGDSLARCAQLWDRKLGGHGHLLALDPDVAAYIAAERIGADPVREKAQAARPSLRDYAVASLMYHAPGRPHAIMHTAFSSLLDWGQPPLFKHFLRVEVSASEISIACHAVTGCAQHAQTVLIEDRLVARPNDGRWQWSTDPLA